MQLRLHFHAVTESTKRNLLESEIENDIIIIIIIIIIIVVVIKMLKSKRFRHKKSSAFSFPEDDF